jgi:hypothetical protein
MKTERFKADVLTGHKGAAVEVPFNPAERWDVPAARVMPGRRGHPVRAALNQVPFESFIVPRAKRSFLLITPEVLYRAQAKVGDTVSVVVALKQRSRS